MIRLRILKRATVCFMVLLLAAGMTVFLMVHESMSRLEMAKQAVVDAGDSLDLVDYAGDPIPDEENAAALLEAACSSESNMSPVV